MPKAATLKKPRLESELLKAADALGRVLVEGCSLATTLQGTGTNPLHPLHANDSEHARETYRRLVAMLVAERWWIEFLLGSTRADDIRLDQFIATWEVPADIEKDLRARKIVIDKLLMHPTWRLIEQEPREWTLTRIDRCVEGLQSLTTAIEPQNSTLAACFNRYVVAARRARQAPAQH